MFSAEAQQAPGGGNGEDGDDGAGSGGSGGLDGTSGELKRDRRLARNRASARLRRQRKRSTIETLEHKIEQLNLRIEKLHGYSFGSGLERGHGLSEEIATRNQPMGQIDEAGRVDITKYYLDNVCRDVKILLNNQVFVALMNSITGAEESTVERRQLQEELRSVINLTEQQQQQLDQELRSKCDVAHQYVLCCFVFLSR